MIMAQDQAMLKGQEQLQGSWELVERAGEEGWRVDQVAASTSVRLLRGR